MADLPGGEANTAAISTAARVTIASVVALAGLEILWELLLAPSPGMRWMAIKAVPLAILVPGIVRGERRARQWLALLAPWYCAEALVRTLTEPVRPALVAAMAAVLALVAFVAVLLWFHAQRRAAPG